MIEVSKDGTVSAIINDKKILLVKRVWLPFILAPGKWTMVSGGRNADESYLECALREVHEETGMAGEGLKLISGPMKVYMSSGNRKWPNMFFIFKARTKSIRLNYENRKYRWASIDDIETGKEYHNVFIRPAPVLRKLRQALSRK